MRNPLNGTLLNQGAVLYKLQVMTARTIHTFIILIFLSGCFMASGNQDKEVRLTISHFKVPCAGESVQLCYVIKMDNGKTEFLHDEIGGFDYQWGYDYSVGVERITKGKPKADASSFTYRLNKIYKKEKVLSGETFELPLMFDDQHLVQNKNGACTYFGAIAIQPAKYSCGDLAKSRSATFRYSADNAGLVLVSLKK